MKLILRETDQNNYELTREELYTKDHTIVVYYKIMSSIPRPPTNGKFQSAFVFNAQKSSTDYEVFNEIV